MTNQIERRFTSGVATPNGVITRGDEGDVRKIVGYAAIFHREGDPGSSYRMYDDLEERILPGAFDRAIEEKHDVRGLFNHDPSKILGRTKSGTVRIKTDSIGLRYEIDVPDTTIGRDTIVSLERGDVDGSSFAFRPVKTRWVEEGDILIREVLDVDLFDVGPVTYPAYEGASSGARAAGMDDLREAAEGYRKLKRARSQSVNVRLKMLDLES